MEQEQILINLSYLIESDLMKLKDKINLNKEMDYYFRINNKNYIVNLTIKENITGLRG